MFEDRSTADVVVILFTIIVGVVLFLAVVGTITGKLINPAIDITRSTELIASVITTIVGALIGFIGGKAQGKLEANGGKDRND